MAKWPLRMKRRPGRGLAPRSHTPLPQAHYGAAGDSAFIHRLRLFFSNSAALVSILVFLGLTLATSSLLMLPIAAADGHATPAPDAFFTAVSAVAVTGLTTVDMATHWSPFGNTVIFIK